MAEIHIQDLHKSFGSFTAVSGSTFVVPDGSFFCLLGPSGCGKTTTLRMIAGLELPTSGRILLGGKDVTDNRASERDIAFVFQLFALYTHLNVRKNIAYPLASSGVKSAEIRQRVEETARILRIDHLLGRKISSLSGGDRQRVALGRAIVRRPLAFLMDEPLGALDAEFRHFMCGELRALHDRINATTVYVTHDQLEAMSLADQIAIMNNGLIEQLDTPRNIYARPATTFVADFIGSPSMNLIPCFGDLRPGQRSLHLGNVEIAIPEPIETASERKLVLGVRPEDVRISDAAPLRGRIFGSEYMGSSQIVIVTTSHGRIRARLPASVRIKVGDQIGMSFASEKLSVFDAGTGRVIRSALHEDVYG